jgi:ferrochelatase
MKSHNYSIPTGVLVTNLGSPEAPTRAAIRKYLSQFLWDPLVVQIPRLLWWPLLNGLVLTTRPKKSAKLYQKIWTPSGSPLVVTTTKLTQKLERVCLNQQLDFKFAMGMRYGDPSLSTALQVLQEQQVTSIIILPLYPQYSRTTTASTFKEINHQLALMNWHPQVIQIDNYASHPSYINALCLMIQAHWQKHTPGQQLLFSFHGIPQKNILKGDPYLDQCLETASKVASQLNLPREKWQVVFQSRFGGEKWLEPYCNQTLQSLPGKGVDHIDVICPGFAVDCLETLEEMAMTNREIFMQAGGKQYNYIPCLNDSECHVQSLLEIILSV